MKKRKMMKPGIYRLTLTDTKGKSYEPKKCFETFRIVILHGKKKREWQCFESYAEAKAFKESGQPDVTPEEKGMTLRQVWTHYQAHGMAQAEVSTRNKLASHVRHLEPIMDTYLKTITPFTVDELISVWRRPEYLKGQKGTRVSYKNELALLKQLISYYRTRFDFSFGQPVLPEHRKKSIVRKSAPKQQKDFSTKQFGLFLTELGRLTAGTAYEGIRVMAEVQYALYGRIQEIAALHYEDFDPASGWITINKKIVWPRFKGQGAFIQRGLKAGDEKRVKSPYAASLLHAWAMKKGIQSGPLFFSGEIPLAYRAIQFRYDRAFLEAGLPFKGTHVIRHAALTEHYQTTGDIYETMKAAGHTDVSTTQVYAKHRNGKLEATQEKMDTKLRALARQLDKVGKEKANQLN